MSAPLPTALPDPLRFTAAALEGLGALIEPGGERLTALLPPTLAQELSLDEAVELSATGAAGALACGIGSPLLEGLVERARRERPQCALRPELPAPLASAARSLAAQVALRNGVAVPGAPQASTDWYLWAALRWVAEADERHEGIYTVVLHSPSGSRPVGDLATLLGSVTGRPVALPAVDRSALAGLLRRAAVDQLQPEIAAVASLGQGRLARDHARIADYYAALVTEAQSKRRRVDPEAREAKVRHLLTERDSRLAALSERYALRVRVEPAALLWAELPTQVVPLVARRRKAERSLLLRLPPGARAFDQLPCEGCAGWIDQPLLCDERQHLLCTRCEPEATGRPRCPACEG